MSLYNLKTSIYRLCHLKRHACALFSCSPTPLTPEHPSPQLVLCTAATTPAQWKGVCWHAGTPTPFWQPPAPHAQLASASARRSPGPPGGGSPLPAGRAPAHSAGRTPLSHPLLRLLPPPCAILPAMGLFSQPFAIALRAGARKGQSLHTSLS